MRKYLLLLPLVASCTDSTDISIAIPFALLASDELSSSSAGFCGYTPITQSQGFYKGSGLLELDPAINPNPEYILGLQIENYLDDTTLTDSNGNPIEGPQRDDFHVQQAVIQYLDEEGLLSAVDTASPLLSGTIRPGGEENAGAVSLNAVGPVVAQSWVQSFQNANLVSEDVVLEIQIFGVLGSGEQTQTGVFRFPLTLCYDCDGISPSAQPGAANACPAQTTAVPVGHGPCCASQDFSATCEACGASGQPCCGTAPGCQGNLTCSGTPSATTSELCPYPHQASVVCAVVTG